MCRRGGLSCGGGGGLGAWGSSPKLAEGPALVVVVGFRVGLPSFPLWRFVVNVGRRARVVIVWVLIHHLELGLDGADFSTRAGGGEGKQGRERERERRCEVGKIPVLDLRARDGMSDGQISARG